METKADHSLSLSRAVVKRDSGNNCRLVSYLAKTVALFLTWHGKTLFIVLPIVIDFVIAGADHVRHETRDRLDLPHEHVAKPERKVKRRQNNGLASRSENMSSLGLDYELLLSLS